MSLPSPRQVAEQSTAPPAMASPPSLLTHEDNRHLLRMLREKERLGVAAEKVEVRFEELAVEADVRVDHRTLPTLFNCVVNAAQELATYSRMCTTTKRPIKIIKGASGAFRPSRMALLLGAPGSGKTTFLKALAGKLDPSLKLKGKVMYNGEEVNPSTPQYQHAYISQYDLHHAEMTVRETIDFSSKMLGTNSEFDKLRRATIRKHGAIYKVDQDLDSVFKEGTFGEGSNLTTNYIIKILGLSECADTIVGDEMRRGISGGQKKRVTIGEMLVGLARCFFMDDISTGLDSSTTYEIIKFLQEMAHLMDLTMVISLLQPPPETLELFDDVILLCEGQIVYHGPRENAIDFFEIMGFKCPGRKNVADFLQEVLHHQLVFAGTTCFLLMSLENQRQTQRIYIFLQDTGQTLGRNAWLASDKQIFSMWIQLIPVWWRWVYWANPAAWTVYGLMFSQLGDRTELILVPGQPDLTVREFLEGYLGLEDRYFNLVTYLHVVIIALFGFLFFFFLKHLNFQRR